MSNIAGHSLEAQPAPSPSQSRSTTTVSQSNPDPTSPETLGRQLISPDTSNKPQPLSYRQLLQQRLQKYQWTANHTVENAGTTRHPLWFSSFWLGTIQIGQSSAHRTKGAAKEEAAKAALDWLTTYGYY
ncbi:hypothetical protein FRB91_001818 [Serendipita sp. 411]|nr:hypothetical protein FRB91_001818 [Serendipita sp. 411]